MPQINYVYPRVCLNHTHVAPQHTHTHIHTCMHVRSLHACTSGQSIGYMVCNSTLRVSPTLESRGYEDSFRQIPDFHILSISGSLCKYKVKLYLFILYLYSCLSLDHFIYVFIFIEVYSWCAILYKFQVYNIVIHNFLNLWVTFKICTHAHTCTHSQEETKSHFPKAILTCKIFPTQEKNSLLYNYTEEL